MLSFFVSLLYPKKCVRCRRGGDYVCANCFATISFLEFQLCGVCQKGSIDGLTHPKCRTKYGVDGIFSILSYRGITKKLLYQFKYPPYLSDLKGTLGRLLYEGLIQQEAFMNIIGKKDVIVMPVPLHLKRLKSRGYNQAELLAKEIATALGVDCVSGVLIRTRNTKPQFKLKKDERRKNTENAFAVNNKLKKTLKGKIVVVVDDISTTGATIRECAKTLKRSGVGKVLGVTLAHEG